jgi:hypothetical protein
MKVQKEKPSDKKKSSSVRDELTALSKFVTGEMAIEKKQQKLAELKKKAAERQNNTIRRKVETQEFILPKESDENQSDPTPKKVIQNITVFEWEAPIRLKFFFEIKVFVGIVAACLVFILYLAILGHYMLMIAIFALLFFIYAAGTVPPINVTHKITKRGVETIDKLYEWYKLESFWFTNKNGQDILFINTKLRLPSKLILLITEKDRASIFMLLQDKLLYHDIRKQSSYNKLVFGDYIPLSKV